MSYEDSVQDIENNLKDYIFDNKYIDTDLKFVCYYLSNQLKFDYNNILLVGNNIIDLLLYIVDKYNNANITYIDINYSVKEDIKEDIKEKYKENFESSNIKYYNNFNKFINDHKSIYKNYDLIVTHNSLLNIINIENIIKLYNQILIINGCLMMIEHCSGYSVDICSEFLNYANKNSYQFYNIFSIAGLLDKYNFNNIKTKDNISILVKNLENDLNNLHYNRNFYIKKYKENIYEKKKNLWNNKLNWYYNKSICWGYIFSVK